MEQYHPESRPGYLECALRSSWVNFKGTLVGRDMQQICQFIAKVGRQLDDTSIDPSTPQGQCLDGNRGLAVQPYKIFTCARKRIPLHCRLVKGVHPVRMHRSSVGF